MVYFPLNIIHFIYSQVINPRITLRVNPAGLRKDILSSLPRMNNHKVLERNLRDSSGQLIYKKISRYKNEMIKEFLQHPVTKEILAGASSGNQSGTLSGYGNLFTFIGFNKGDNPIQPIIQLLNQTNYHFTKFDNKGSFTVNIEIPSADQIFRATPLPWAPGMSWAQRIEVGMPGFGQYMNKTSNTSRSGLGIQTKNPIRPGGFKNTRYISDFINRWTKKFKTIGSVTTL
jgi:hypothetical protein